MGVSRTPVQPDVSSDVPPDMSLDIPPDELTSIETSSSIVCIPADLVQRKNRTETRHRHKKSHRQEYVQRV